MRAWAKRDAEENTVCGVTGVGVRACARSDADENATAAAPAPGAALAGVPAAGDGDGDGDMSALALLSADRMEARGVSGAGDEVLPNVPAAADVRWSGEATAAMMDTTRE